MYRLIKSKAEDQETAGIPAGGVAMLVHEDLEGNMAHIQKANRTIMEIALRFEGSRTYVAIINTYAPRKGETKVEQEAHWNKRSKQ